MVSTANTPNTTQGIRSGGKILALEIIDYMLQSYGLPKLEKTKNENEEKKEIQYARTNLLQIQRQFSTGKLLFICIGHSLGGLYLRNAIGYLYENLFFHFSEGPIAPFVCIFYSISNFRFCAFKQNLKLPFLIKYFLFNFFISDFKKNFNFFN